MGVNKHERIHGSPSVVKVDFGNDDSFREDLLKMFSFYTGINVVLKKDASWFSRFGGDTVEKVSSGRLPGRYDRINRTAYVYTGSTRGNDRGISPGTLAARLVNLVFRNLSFSEIFDGTRFDVVHNHLRDLVGKEGSGLVDLLFSRNPDLPFLRSYLAENNGQLMLVSAAIQEMFRFPQEDFLTSKIAGAISSGVGGSLFHQLNEGDRETIRSSMLLALTSETKPAVVNVGNLSSDFYRSLGFPNMSVVVSPATLSAFLKDNSIPTEEFIDRFLSVFDNPIVALRINDVDKQGRSLDRMNFLFDFGKDCFLALSVEPPLKCISKKLGTNDPHKDSVYARVFSAGVGSVCHYINTGSIARLAEGKDRFGMKTYPLLAALEKKAEARSLAGIISASSIRPLLCSSANIINNFRNPKLLDENYDPVLIELDKRARFQQELKDTLNLDGAPVKAVPKPEEPKFSVKDRIPARIMSKASYRKLLSNNILTIGNLLEKGGHMILMLTDKATVNKIEKYLSGYNKTLFPREKAVAPSDFNMLSDDDKLNAVLRDFGVAVKYLPEGFSGKEMLTPVNVDGLPIVDAAGFHLAAKLASMSERWCDFAMFVTPEWIEKNQFSLNHGAEPVNVVGEGGVFRSYYNVMDTDVPTKDPVLFDSLNRKTQNKDIVLDKFFNYIYVSLKASAVDSKDGKINGLSRKNYRSTFEHYGKIYTDRVKAQFGLKKGFRIPFSGYCCRL